MPCPTCGAPHACPFQLSPTIPPRVASPRGFDGIFNVNKPLGKTSHHIVHTIRKMSGIARVGHAGTLDPMATGVLLICVGQAVRVTEYLIDHDKKYRARVRLGVETDTYDAEGAIVARRAVTATDAQVADALTGFIGKCAQMPPAYSAIKKDGVHSYDLARRGIEVERTPRPVEIFSIDIRAIALPDVEFDVHCSKGTYIRSLAHDLGEALGCGATLTALTRTASGQFALDDAITLDQLHDAFETKSAEHFLNPLDEALLQFQAVIVNDEDARRVLQGNSLDCEREYATPLLRAYAPSGQCIALLERGKRVGEWKPHKVFISDF
ncbi:MAG: tRNA pseudouridine(55) synthase TruB [Anaerolineales bacterium]|nr:tRNA pseudouridine(55) synthase TruB [Anaerolineales bacterium]